MQQMLWSFGSKIQCILRWISADVRAASIHAEEQAEPAPCLLQQLMADTLIFQA